MNIVKKISSSTALALALGAPVHAFVITPLPGDVGGNPGDVPGYSAIAYEVSELKAGDAFNMNWSLEGSDPPFNGDLPDLSATGMLTVNSLTSMQIQFTVMMSNTTTPLPGADPPPDLTAPITSFGLELDGFSSGSLSVPGMFLDTYDTGNISGGTHLSADFCSSTNSGCNTGQPGDGIQIGGTDTFTFLINGAFDPTLGVTMRNFATKWQTNYDDIVQNVDDNSSFELTGVVTRKGNVPEPATLALMGLGLAGFCYQRRRKISSL